MTNTTSAVIAVAFAVSHIGSVLAIRYAAERGDSRAARAAVVWGIAEYVALIFFVAYAVIA